MVVHFAQLLMASLLGWQVADATLPADNGGAPTYAVGDSAPHFEVAVSNFSGVGNYSLVVPSAQVPSSLIILSVAPPQPGGHADLFVQHMIFDNSSLDAFLGSDAVGASAIGNTSYLFVANCATDKLAATTTAALRTRLSARAAALGLQPQKVLTRMHFAAQSVAPPVVGQVPVAPKLQPLVAWLASWQTPVTSITFPGLTVSRLDGKYGSCPWPSENLKFGALVDGGDGCKPMDGETFAGKWVVLTTDGCSPATAAAHGTGSGAAGAVIVAAKDTLPVEMNSCGNSRGLATMISGSDGTKLKQIITESGGTLTNGSFASIRRPGAFAAIDASGHMQELGWEKFSTMQMLSWAAQYLDYLSELTANMSKPHFSIPLFDRAQGGSTTVTIPPPTLLRAFSTMEVEHRLECQDNPRMDESCPAWDHNIALGVACAATPAQAHRLAEVRFGQQTPTTQQTESVPPSTALNNATAESETPALAEPGGYVGELARWITPFRRRIGHWLTPATTLMPYLTEEGKSSCAFHIQAPGGWVSTMNLRFSGSADKSGLPPSVTTPLFTGGDFGKDYNVNRTLQIPLPKMPLPRVRRLASHSVLRCVRIQNVP